MAGGTFAALSGVSGVHATSAVCWIRPHVGNIAVSEASAHSQHGATRFKKYRGAQPAPCAPRPLRFEVADRGKELTDHRRFTLATNIDVYFCDPQSS